MGELAITFKGKHQVTHFFQLGPTFQSIYSFPKWCHHLRTKCLTHIPIGGSFSWNYEPRLSGNKKELCNRGRFQFNRGKTGRQNKDCLTIRTILQNYPRNSQRLLVVRKSLEDYSSLYGMRISTSIHQWLWRKFSLLTIVPTEIQWDRSHKGWVSIKIPDPFFLILQL